MRDGNVSHTNSETGSQTYPKDAEARTQKSQRTRHREAATRTGVGSARRTGKHVHSRREKGGVMLMARGKGVVCLMQGSIVVRAHVGPAVGVDQRAIATTVGHAGAPHHINQNQNARSPVSTHTLEHEHCRRKEKQTSSEHCERQQNPRTQTNMQRAGGRRAKGGRASKRAHTYLLSGIVDMKDVAAAANMSPSKTDESDCDL